MSHKKVTLMLPGYMSGFNLPSAGSSTGEGAESLRQVPASFRFSEDLARQPWQAQLAHILGLNTSGGKRLPGARLGLLSPDEQSNPPEIDPAIELVRADPIFLKADRDSAKLISPAQLALSEEESATLIEALNDFVAEDGLSFFSRSPGEWYMSGRSAEALESYPPSFLANRNASSFLPDGDEAAPWRRLMTELQMLLHAHPINQQREQRGLMPVNSVWFWGGAPLPAPVADSSEVVVYADEQEVRSLVQHLGMTCLPLVQFHSDIQAGFTAEEVVLVDLSVVQAWINADAQQFDDELARIHEHLMQPLSRLVSAGQLQRVHLMTEDGIEGICDENTQPALPGPRAVWAARIRSLFGQ